jgi:uncharacterized repeat protein (TIGR03803 family)
MDAADSADGKYPARVVLSSDAVQKLQTRKYLIMNNITSLSRSRAVLTFIAGFRSLPLIRRVFAVAGLMLALAATPVATASSFSTAFVFNGTNGSYPNSMFLASDGNLYGTTLFGGTNGSLGTIFELNKTGRFHSLFSFNGTNGSLPVGFSEGADGVFYGVTSQGGSNSDGTIFKITTNTVMTTLVTFNGTNGSLPQSGLVQSPVDGSFYGTTSIGGTNGNNGTVYQLTTNGAFKTILSFNSTNGSSPYGMLTFGKDGSLYGTTYFGGSNQNGTIFRITTNGVITNLFIFDGANFGGSPYSGVIQGTDNNLYGTTSQGSSNGFGSIFRISTNGTGFTTLAAFNGTSDTNIIATPYGPLTQAADGSFYGTTLNGGTNNNMGTLYHLTTNFVLSQVVSFGDSNGAAGAVPRSALVVTPSSDLFGTTTSGVGTNSPGTIFKLALVDGSVPPITISLAANNSTLSFSWNSLPGITYQLQSNSAPGVSDWTNFGSAVLASNTTTTVTGTLGTTGGLYYRVIGIKP